MCHASMSVDHVCRSRLSIAHLSIAWHVKTQTSDRFIPTHIQDRGGAVACRIVSSWFPCAYRGACTTHGNQLQTQARRYCTRQRNGVGVYAAVFSPTKNKLCRLLPADIDSA